MKTKPTQHSVKELREIGIQPDVVLCRADRPLPRGRPAQDRAVHQRHARGGDPGARRRLDLQDSRRAARRGARRDRLQEARRSSRRPPTSSTWNKLVDALEHPEHAVHIAMVGKYVDLTESYKSLSEALTHAGIHTRSKVTSTTSIPRRSSATASTASPAMDAILVPGGFGKRGVEGKIAAIRYARENGIPYLGICLGMQLAVIEYARHKAGLDGANSTEFDPDTPHPVVALITEWQNRDGSIERRAANSDLGGTMRLGGAAVRGRRRARSRTGSTARRRSPSGTGIATKSTTITCRGSRPPGLVVGARAQERDRRRPVRDDRAAAASVVLRLPVPPGIHVEPAPRPSAVHRLRARRARAPAARAGRHGSEPTPSPSWSRRSDAASALPMKLCGFDVGLDRPLFLIAGPCVVESRAAADRRRRQAEGDCARRSASRSSSSRRTTRPTAARARRSAGRAWTKGLRILAEVKRQIGVPVLTDVHAEPTMCRRWRRWSTCCRRRRSCAGRPISSRRWRAPASRSTSRRASSSRPRT